MRFSKMRTYALSGPGACGAFLFNKEMTKRIKILDLSMMNVLLNSFNTWCVDVNYFLNLSMCTGNIIVSYFCFHRANNTLFYKRMS